jgi:hypothetical protein
MVRGNRFRQLAPDSRQYLPRDAGFPPPIFAPQKWTRVDPLHTRTKHVADALGSTGGEQHEVIEVPLLDIEDAVELFLAHFNAGEIDVSPSKIEEIVKDVGCLPLAISHAAAYMKQSNSTLDEILRLYRSEHKIDVSHDLRTQLAPCSLCCRS